MGVKAEIRGLFVYPLKSCRPIALQEAELGLQGLKFDRHWMVVSESGRAQTQRDIPLLSQIHTALDGDQLVLSRLDMVPLNCPCGMKTCRPGHSRYKPPKCGMTSVIR